MQDLCIEVLVVFNLKITSVIIHSHLKWNTFVYLGKYQRHTREDLCHFPPLVPSFYQGLFVMWTNSIFEKLLWCHNQVMQGANCISGRSRALASSLLLEWQPLPELVIPSSCMWFVFNIHILIFYLEHAPQWKKAPRMACMQSIETGQFLPAGLECKQHTRGDFSLPTLLSPL